MTPGRNENPTIAEEGNLSPKKRKIAIVETGNALEEQSRDVAESNLTESKSKLKGVKGFFTKIWKHNLFNEYYRQVEIIKVKEKILQTGNLYEGENAGKSAHDKAMSTVVDRFLNEYEESVHTEAGEERKILNNDPENASISMSIRSLIHEFASGRIDESVFTIERDRVIAKATNIDSDTIATQLSHTDNLLEVAKQVKLDFENGKSLDALDSEIEITLGKAKLGVRTEAKYNTVDRLVNKIKNTKIGRLVNETTVALAVAGAYSVTVGLSQRLARSKALAWGTFGASALLGGLVAGAKESVKITDERRQHSREKAKGEVFDANSERRVEMDAFTHKTVSCPEINSQIESLTKKLSTQEDFVDLTQLLAEVENRIKISDRDKIDLLSYTNIDSLEKERFALDESRAKAKIAIRKKVAEGSFVIPNGSSFEEYYNTISSLNRRNLIEGDDGIEQTDRLFSKMKRRKISKAAVKGVVTGLIIGGVAQEVKALLSDDLKGVTEGVFGANKTATKVSALEGLRKFFFKEELPVVREIEADYTYELTGGNFITLPPSLQLVPSGNPDIYSLYHNGTLVSDTITFENGGLSAESATFLNEKGILSTQENFTTTTVEQTQAKEVIYGSREYIDKNPGEFSKIRREMWYDNNTKKFDKNELKLHWGGKSGTGIDKDGNYVFNVAKMKAGGSFHGSESVNPQNAIKDGKLSMLLSLSRETEFDVVRVPIDSNGNAIIDPNSSIGKLFFKVDTDGQLIYKGAFAEVGYQLGEDSSGIPRFGIMATDVGEGINSVTDMEESTSVTIENTHIINHLEDTQEPDAQPEPGYDIEPPLFIPVFGRTPLEKTRKTKSPITPYYGFSNPEDIIGEMERAGLEPDPYFIKKVGEDVMWVNKEGDSVSRSISREKERISKYLEKQDKSYTEELEAFEKKVEPMDPKCRLSINIPARFESKNLSNLLDQYVKQVDENGNPLDKDVFEINIIVNIKEGEKADDSVKIIEEWKKKNPGYHVNYIDIIFPQEKANVGMARKYITDLTLLRSQNRKTSSGPLYIETEDADLFGIDKRAVSQIIKKFDEGPELDVLRGVQDRQPEIMQKNDLLLFERRLWDIMEVFMRKQAYRPDNMKGSSFVWNRVISGGWNTAYTAEVYAQIGGYVSDIMGEDMKIGQKISMLRGSRNEEGQYLPNTQTAKTSGLRFSSSPRRFIDAMIKKQGAYDDFDNQELKDSSLDELLEGVKDSAVATPEQIKKYEEATNVLGSFIKEQIVQPQAGDVFKRVLWWMGLRENHYILNAENNSIELTKDGMDNIIEILKKYKESEKYKLGYRRQNSTLG